MRLRAYAKINLSLEIRGRRADGFHDLASVMQTVGLWDELTIEPSHSLTFTCTDPALAGDGNLVMRAARLLREEVGVTAGGRLHLVKRIPVAAGLGGGSSDAAAALIGLKRLWSLHHDRAALATVAAQVGSDVPFFLYGGTALVRGRGEVVTPLPPPRVMWYTLVNPGVAVSTAEVFGHLKPESWTDGRRTFALASEIRGRRGAGIGPNGLQESLFSLYPQARACFHRVSRVAPGHTFVSGSGPTVVVASDTEEGARRVLNELGGEGWWCAVAPAAQGASGDDVDGVRAP